MLAALSIRDIVLIETLNLAFDASLTVLTGETGAGKSILLDALSLALGARGDAGLVRAGCEQGQVTAAFDVPMDHPARTLVAESGLDADGDIMFGLADIGYPELGSWSFEELRSIRLPFGMGIERDLLFTGDVPISVWADTARDTGSIREAERHLYWVIQVTPESI